MQTRPRPARTAAWTAAKLLLFAALVALGVAVWIVTRPIANPGVQDCGTTASFFLHNTENVVVHPGEPGAPPNAPELSQQPTCRELALFEIRKASLAAGAFLALALLGILVGLLDDRVDYWRAPRFEDLLRPLPPEERVAFGLVPRVDADDLARALPPVDPWEVTGLVAFGIAGLVTLRLVAGTDAWSAAWAAVSAGGVVALVVVAVLPFLAAAVARWGAFPPGTPVGVLARHVVGSSWSGRLRPYAGAFGIDLHLLRRRRTPRAAAVGAVQALELTSLAAHLLTLVVGGWAVVGALDADLTFDVRQLVAIGVAGFLVLYGLTLLGRRWRALPVRPGSGGVAALRALATGSPVQAVALVAGSLAQPLLEALVLTTAVGLAGGSVGLAAALGVTAVARTAGVVGATHEGTFVVDVALLGGLVAVGVDPGVAAVAALAARVVTFWLPLVAGLPAARAEERSVAGAVLG